MERIQKKIDSGVGRDYTHHEASDIYERDGFDLSIAYSEIMKTFSLGLFYLPIIPYSTFICLFIIFIQYNNDKVYPLLIILDLSFEALLQDFKVWRFHSC